MKRLIAYSVSLVLLTAVAAQNKVSQLPQSLLWEITGNGLQKPSYLFGTMHVSNKMVFNLGDSFYNAIAACDMVSLEIDPKQWQPEMFRLQRSRTAMIRYAMPGGYDFLKERSFRINKNYEDRLKSALNEEPSQANGLLYRTYNGQADFQENTYLDLYIYQTARRLGKKATGVEDYLTSEKIQLEATEDMSREKRKPRGFNGDGDNMFDIQRKMQDAYRRGDLNMLDSLNKLTTYSEAYNEKFMYKRNEIQANSIDSILRKATLFVGVGAAHLPGERGVIDLLQKKGYILRAVNMNDRDATQKDRIDKLKVPVVMQQCATSDGFVQLQMPGQFFKRDESPVNESWQYADMENGSYYMLTRIKTHAGLLGQDDGDVLKKTDSLLYENIPGKILHKTRITKNGYPGYDITNKTRRGDIQRYQILVTPSEILVFKMSGNDDYVNGQEADTFFNSIHLKEINRQWVNYSPFNAGFTVTLPQMPNVSRDQVNEDRLDGWQYEAKDAATGDAYMVWQKNLQNYQFLEEDTFDLSLVEESLKGSDIIEKQLLRKPGKWNGYDCLDMVYSLKEGGTLKAKALIRGSQYYLLLARSKGAGNNFTKFFNSFKLNTPAYGPLVTYADTSLGFTVNTPVKPSVDSDLHGFIERSIYSPALMRAGDAYQPEPQSRYAYFRNDSTGESIQVTVTTLPKYYYRQDSTKFWEDEMRWTRMQQDMLLQKKQSLYRTDSILGYTYTYADTNTNRRIKGLVMLKGNKLYKLNAITDGASNESAFINNFFASFQPTAAANGYNVFRSKTDLFFTDYSSTDSAMRKMTRNAIPSVTMEGKDLPAIQNIISGLDTANADYTDTKTKWIQAIGHITDTVAMASRVSYLRELNESVADTGSFQNAIVQALAYTKSREAFLAVKDIITQNPVLFENAWEYSLMFHTFSDSLALASLLYPDILQLATLEDYKVPVNNLLNMLVDSGYLKGADYAAHFNSLLFDAQVHLKKLQNRNEKEMIRQKAAAQNNDEEAVFQFNGGQNSNNTAVLVNRFTSQLGLLIPFYDKNPAVPRLFNKLLQGTDNQVRTTVLVLLARYDKPIPDSALNAVAADDQYRATLYDRLQKAKKENIFPEKYKTQEAMAKSILAGSRTSAKLTEISLVGKQYVESKNVKGYVYFFKYRMQKQGDWLIGVAGVQPEDSLTVKFDRTLVSLSDRKLKTTEPEMEQFEKRLQQLLLTKRKSGTQFYNERGNGRQQIFL